MNNDSPESRELSPVARSGQEVPLRLMFLALTVLAMWISALGVEGCSNTPGNEAAVETVGLEPNSSSETTAKVEPSPEKSPGQETTNLPEPSKEPSSPEPSSDQGTTESPSPVETVADEADGGTTTPCTGIAPPYTATEAGVPPEIELPEDLQAPDRMLTPDETCTYKPGLCLGGDAPNWMLEDFQPQSCGYQKSYNLKAFRGHVTVVALLSGW
ncbi:MAG: hypothetical protein EP343_12325 [Deltaproteobacteria bacterium]|nr:MAG: hypothetical protein EP343_12325 [Deltaproteobacteria bacterium]